MIFHHPQNKIFILFTRLGPITYIYKLFISSLRLSCIFWSHLLSFNSFFMCLVSSFSFPSNFVSFFFLHEGLFVMQNYSGIYDLPLQHGWFISNHDYSIGLDSSTQSLKKAHTWVIQVLLTRKLHPYWLDFIMLGGDDVQATGEQKHTSVLPSCELSWEVIALCWNSGMNIIGISSQPHSGWI